MKRESKIWLTTTDNEYQIPDWILVSTISPALMGQVVSLEMVKDGNRFARMESGEKPVSLRGSSVSPSSLIYRGDWLDTVVDTIKETGSTETTAQLWNMKKPFNKKMGRVG